VSVPLYLDVHIPHAIADGLRLREVDVLTAQEDSSIRLSDADLLSRSTAMGRALVTFDKDLLIEATNRQQHGAHFAGVVFAHPLQMTIGACVKDLELLAKVGEPGDIANQIIFLPL